MVILATIPEGDIRDAFFPPEVAEELERCGNVVWNPSRSDLAPDELRDRVKGADVCVTGWGTTAFTPEILSQAGSLGLIVHTGGSVASLAGDEVFSRGIRVVSGNEMYMRSVAEGTLAYMLCSLRDLPFYSNEAQEGRWGSAMSASEGLLGQKVGIVGFGSGARHLLKLLEPFDVEVLVHSGHLDERECAELGIQKASLEELFSTCKVITLQNSLTPKTYHMIGKDLLARMRDGAILVNTARGAVINEKELEDELLKGRTKAILDVFEKEPLPADSRLRGLKNVILMPHMAGPTRDRFRSITLELIGDIKRHFEGKELRHEITRERAGFMTQNM
jgi:phosphoglycerate dehydrogenase-like enzyme